MRGANRVFGALFALLFALVAVQGGVVSSRDVRDAESGNVVNLTKDDFHARLKAWEMSLVTFYAKWCSESQALLPKVQEAAKGLHKSGSAVQLAAVEATKFPEIRHEHRVAIFPTILVFVNGQPVGQYTGDVTPQAIHDFVEKLRASLKSQYMPKLGADEHSNTADSMTNSVGHAHGHMMQLTADSFQTEVGRHQYAVVNFGANWCKWTRSLLPEFTKAGELLRAVYPGVLLASVDCEQEPQLEHAYRIHAFPTLLLFRCGHVVGRYAGPRTGEAIVDFVQTWVQAGTEQGAPAPVCRANSVAPTALSAQAAANEEGDVVLGMIVAGCVVGVLLLFSACTVCYACRVPQEEQSEPRYWWHYAAGVRTLPGTEITESPGPDKPKASLYQPVFVRALDIDSEEVVESEDGKLLG